MRRHIAIATALGVLSTTTLAYGDAKTSETMPRHERYVTGGIGSFGSLSGFGLLADFLGIWRIGPVAFGANVQLGAALFHDRYVAVAPMAGLLMHTSQRNIYWGILGTIGANHYDGVGRSLGSDDPGFSTTMPYAGVRGIVGSVRGQGPVRFTVAFHGFVNVDLYRETRTYIFFSSGDSGFFLAPSNGPGEEEVTHTAGTLRIGAMLALGAAF